MNFLTSAPSQYTLSMITSFRSNTLRNCKPMALRLLLMIPYPPSAICYSHFVACNPLPVGFYMCSVYKHFLLRETWKYNIRGSFVVTRGHSWSLVVIRGHSWSFVVTRGHSCVLLDKIHVRLYSAFFVKFCYRFCRFFLLFQVNFNLQKTSATVSSVYFLSLDCFLAFRHFYSSSTITFTPWSVLESV